MIPEVDERLCEDFDEGLKSSEKALVRHLTWKIKELIDLVNRLQTTIEKEGSS